MYDVCLLLEGTYPFVAGGVSTWVHHLIQNMPHLTFSIVYLGPHRPPMRKFHYSMPENVVDFHEYYLFSYRYSKQDRKKYTKDDIEVMRLFIKSMVEGDTSLFREAVRLVGDEATRRVTTWDLAHSSVGWEMVLSLYESLERKPSFVDFFWSWRFIYLPFFSLLQVHLPLARVYHSVSTGYAGALGALAKVEYERPFILTEHGIYTRERKMELTQADWIQSELLEEVVIREKQQDFFREWWRDTFSFFSKLTYDEADKIITLFEGNRQAQIADGADPKKISVIPNGIELTSESVLRSRKATDAPRVALIGRVVPIKDIKTYIRAAKFVRDVIPNVEVLVYGPTDEDDEYYHECLDLVRDEHLTETITFMGKTPVDEIYPEVDVIVLTSTSEAQPLVVLEAGAYGLPCVATDVGSCKELLEGTTLEDQLIGSSGIVTALCNPEATAQAVTYLLNNPNEAAKMGERARKRVSTYYRRDHFITSYLKLYSHYMEQVRWPA